MFCESKGHIKTIDAFCKYIIEKVQSELNTSVGVLSSRALELME